MILVSCRKDFADTRAFAEHTIIRDFPSLANLDEFVELDDEALAERMQGRHVLFLIHGFRNPLRNVASAYQRIARGLADINAVGDAGYGLIVGFAWPGFATPLGFFPAVPFANRSAGFFRSLLELASRSARTVDVQTHSLGARVALQALGWKGPQHPAVIAAECPDLFVVDCKKAVASHGGYRSAPRYYEHWSRVLQELPLPQFDALKA